MKVLICANALIGDSTTLGMPTKSYAKWQEDRIDALAVALRRAVENGVEKCFILGGLFGAGFVPQHLLDDTTAEIEACELPVVYLPYPGEDQVASAAMKLPPNLKVVQQNAALFNLDLVNGCEVQVQREDEISVSWKGDEGKKTVQLGNLEPVGFNESRPTGFLAVDIVGGVCRGSGVGQSCRASFR